MCQIQITPQTKWRDLEKIKFSRYMSVGLTPEEIKKMFCIEALVIAGRPIILTVPLAGITAGYLLKISYLEVETARRNYRENTVEQKRKSNLF